MSFLQRLKKDKPFRVKVILIFVALVLMAGSIKEDKKGFQDPAVCDGVNPLFTTAEQCEAQGCFPVVESVLKLIYYDCISCGAPGKYVSMTSAAQGCCTGSGTDQNVIWSGNPIFLCKDVPSGAGGACTSEFQRSVASMIPFDIGGCQTKFYLIAFGGGFIALILIIAVF